MSLVSALYQLKSKFSTSSYYVFNGFCSKKPVSVLVLGTDAPLRFYPKLLGATAIPQKKTILNWNIPKLIASCNADVVICHCPRFLLPGGLDFLTLPEFVSLELPINGSFEDYVGKLKCSARSDVRGAKKSGFSCQKSKNPEELDDFYYNLHVPSMTSRHQEDAFIYPIDYVREFFKNGFLLTASKEGEPMIAAYLIKDCGESLWGKFFGIRTGADKTKKVHAIPTLTLELIRYAYEHNYKYVNFGLSLPYRADSAFFFKQKWGNRICLPNYRIGRIYLAFKDDEHKELFWKHSQPITLSDVKNTIHSTKGCK